MARKQTSGKLRYDIAERRVRLGLSQKELAKKARVTQSALSCWERGFWEPTKLDQINRINSVLSARLPRRSNGN